MLDTKAGCDYLIEFDYAGCQTLAHRAQKVFYPSFTERLCEYKRIKAALEQDKCAPTWICQSYLTGQELEAVGLVKTSDLYAYIRNHWPSIEIKTNPQDGQRFVIVWWQNLVSSGVDFHQWPSK